MWTRTNLSWRVERLWRHKRITLFWRPCYTLQAKSTNYRTSWPLKYSRMTTCVINTYYFDTPSAYSQEPHCLNIAMAFTLTYYILATGITKGIRVSFERSYLADKNFIALVKLHQTRLLWVDTLFLCISMRIVYIRTQIRCGSVIVVTKVELFNLSVKTLSFYAHTPVRSNGSHSYLTDINAANRRRHLSSMNVIFDR